MGILYLTAVGGGTAEEQDILIDSGGATWLAFFGVYQGAVMFLQEYYQSQRHYVRKALMKKGAMDVRNTEVIEERPHGAFALLVPALYGVYFLQLVTGIYFAWIANTIQANPASYLWYQPYQVYK